MTAPRLLTVALLALCGACTHGTSLRALSSEAATAPRPEPLGPTRRIGAPGGSGAGPRSVGPAQSGKEAVGGLPAGSGKSGRRG